MAKGLTQRQKSILDYIIESIRESGYPPTLVELCEAFEIGSTNAVNDHLRALEKKGYIERSSKARGIRAMLPHVHEFRPVHNLASLADLVAALSDPRAGRRHA